MYKQLLVHWISGYLLSHIYKNVQKRSDDFWVLQAYIITCSRTVIVVLSTCVTNTCITFTSTKILRCFSMRPREKSLSQFLTCIHVGLKIHIPHFFIFFLLGFQDIFVVVVLFCYLGFFFFFFFFLIINQGGTKYSAKKQEKEKKSGPKVQFKKKKKKNSRVVHRVWGLKGKIHSA